MGIVSDQHMLLGAAGKSWTVPLGVNADGLPIRQAWDAQPPAGVPYESMAIWVRRGRASASNAQSVLDRFKSGQLKLN